MKQYLLLILCTFAALCNYAQTENPHLTFKGIPIDGTSEEFVQKLTKKGFTFLQKEDDMSVLFGDFAGRTDCKIYACSQPDKDLIYSVGVVFPNHTTWSGLSGDYFYFKNFLIEKYGEPMDTVEKFVRDISSASESFKMYLVRQDECKYQSIFKTDKGYITLLINHIDSDCFIFLVYYDKINSEEKDQQVLDDL